MMIRKVSGGLEIGISADDCALLARACRHAADATQEDGPGDDDPSHNRTDSYLFYLAASVFDAYALIGDADNRLRPGDREGWDLPGVCKEWSPLVWDGGQG